jgi:hypothetical protein
VPWRSKDMFIQFSTCSSDNICMFLWICESMSMWIHDDSWCLLSVASSPWPSHGHFLHWTHWGFKCLPPRYSDTPTVLISLWCGGLFCAVLTIAVTVYNVRRHYESAREQGLGRLGWNQLCAVSTDGSDKKRFRLS